MHYVKFFVFFCFFFKKKIKKKKVKIELENRYVVQGGGESQTEKTHQKKLPNP